MDSSVFFSSMVWKQCITYKYIDKGKILSINLLTCWVIILSPISRALDCLPTAFFSLLLFKNYSYQQLTGWQVLLILILIIIPLKNNIVLILQMMEHSCRGFRNVPNCTRDHVEPGSELRILWVHSQSLNHCPVLILLL